jgi:hypothetical protein
MNEEHIERLLAGGRELEWQVYKESSQYEIKRYWKMYVSFREMVSEAGKLNDVPEEEVVAAWAVSQLERGLRGQTVQVGTVLVFDALRLNGVRVDEERRGRIVKALGRHRVPPIKANPLRWEQLVAYVGSGENLACRALAAVIWLTMKRPAHLVIPVSNVFEIKEGPERLLVIYLPDDKNMMMMEDWRVKKIALGVFEKVVLDHLTQRKVRGGDNLWFTSEDTDRLYRSLTKLRVTQEHPYLRRHYTLFSLRRGSIQHAAHAGKVPTEIATLSDHRSLASLALYIGAFLDPKVQSGFEVSQATSRPTPTPVPNEYLTPTGVAGRSIPQIARLLEERPPEERHTEVAAPAAPKRPRAKTSTNRTSPIRTRRATPPPEVRNEDDVWLRFGS